MPGRPPPAGLRWLHEAWWIKFFLAQRAGTLAGCLAFLHVSTGVGEERGSRARTDGCQDEKVTDSQLLGGPLLQGEGARQTRMATKGW